MSFTPTAPSGLLLHIGNATKSRDFISLSLINQYVELRYDLGSGVTMLMGAQVSLGNCHTISVSRYQTTATLTVNNVTTPEQQSQGTSTQLNTASDMLVGGVDSVSSVSALAGTMVGFSGCINNLMVCGQSLLQAFCLLQISFLLCRLVIKFTS